LPPPAPNDDQFDYVSGVTSADHLNQLGSARNCLSIGADYDISGSEAGLFRRSIWHHGLHEGALDSLRPERLRVVSAQLAQYHPEHGPGRRRSGRLSARTHGAENSTNRNQEPKKNFQLHSLLR
jgi:hypothetical protein